jgi:hypothetical protein
MGWAWDKKFRCATTTEVMPGMATYVWKTHGWASTRFTKLIDEFEDREEMQKTISGRFFLDEAVTQTADEARADWYGSDEALALVGSRMGRRRGG